MQHLGVDEMRHALIKIIKDMPLELRQESMTEEERVKGLPPEERVKGLLPEERLLGLSPDELGFLGQKTRSV